MSSVPTNQDNPNELVFWKRHLTAGSLLDALKLHPEHAERIFGSRPAKRANLLQLGMILGAREILETPHGQLTHQPHELLEVELAAALTELPEAERAMATEFLSVKNQEEVMRSVAAKIIEDAIGRSR